MERCHEVTMKMGLTAVRATRNAMKELKTHDDKRAESIREDEQTADRYEDELGTYLVKLSGCHLNEQDRVEAAELLHMIGDFERISDHAVNLMDSVQEMHDKKMSFSSAAAAVTTLNTEPGVKVEERKRLRYTPSYRASPS